MEPTDWIGAIAGVVGVVVAIGALLVAVRANGRSADANRIAREALEVQRAALPPTWSAIEAIGENVVGFRNQSSRAIIVTSLAVEPDEAAEMVIADPRPIRVEYGDWLALRVEARYMAAPRGVDIVWRFEDESEETSRLSKRRL